MMPDGPGVINTTYLDQIERVVAVLTQYEIYTILDFHQDVLSPRLCGPVATLRATCSNPRKLQPSAHCNPPQPSATLSNPQLNTTTYTMLL